MVTFRLNGEERSLDIAPDTPLLWAIRDEIGLTGTKFGCGVAQCGACTVHLDGYPTRSCSLPVGDLEGMDIVTIEGVDGCSVKKVKRERKRLKANLNALGDRLKKDQGPTGKIQNHLAEQFDRLNSPVVYKAAKNIRCQLGVRDQFVGALGRFERYRDLVSGIIDESDMPADLLYLPFVESSYRADIWSKVGAAGMWQIMPNTARTLGMELNAVLDERLDPEAATRGAMLYFKNAQKKLIPLSREKKPGATMAEINPFIVTSYNYGINGMRRAIKQLGPDFPRVLNEYKSAAFQVAVKNFYASFLAARFLARNA